MKLFFDTETTGLVNWKLPDNDEIQPNLVQLAYILTEDNGTIVRSLNTIIKGFYTISDEVAKIHGITPERMNSFGVSFIDIVDIVFNDFCLADLHIAHNWVFDKVLINKAMFLQDYPMPCELSKKFCTKEAMTDICKIPFSSGRRWGTQRYKWPSLQEAYKHLFGEQFEGAHNALSDVKACMRIYFELEKRKTYNLDGVQVTCENGEVTATKELP